MDGILVTLKNLSFAQMVLAWLFVACYALALGGMLSTQGRLRAIGAAVISSVSFAALSDDWVHGALLMLFAVGGMALFVITSWVLTYTSAWLLQHGERAAPPAVGTTAVADTAAPSHGVLGALKRLRLSLS
jgi:hypothetical protein